MPIILIFLAILTLLIWCAVGGSASLSLRKMRYLIDVDETGGDTPSPLPRVSVIVTAKDEERYLEFTVRRILAQDYPNLEVVCVNDRSDDRTGEIADRLSAEDPRVKALHISELPDGWYGKPHALHRSIEAASGEVILYNDADSVHERGAIPRAVSYFMREGLDYLSVIPRVSCEGAILRACMMVISAFLLILARPWSMRDPKSSAYYGNGPFIMLRADKLKSVGGLKSIALCPDDDMMIAKFAKKQGFKCDVLAGIGLLNFEWYSSVGELTRGLEKNFFARFEYSIPRAIAGTLLFLWLLLGPTVLLVLALDGGVWAAAAVAALASSIALYIGIKAAVSFEYPWWNGLIAPFGILIMVYILWRTIYLNLTKGVSWGGVTAPVSELRKRRV